MKRFFTRHMSLRRSGQYTLLSCSDSKLDRTLQTEADKCDKTEDTTRNVSQFRRRLRTLSRRKKHRESETTLARAGESTTRSSSTYEIGVEASPCHDDEATAYAGHGTLTRSVSTSLLDIRNAGVDVEHCTEVNTTPGLPVHQHIAQIHTASCASSGAKPSHLQGRRFAICEELERDLIMDNGVNLRKSRKNLVIRQVLHDLLLL